MQRTSSEAFDRDGAKGGTRSRTPRVRGRSVRCVSAVLLLALAAGAVHAQTVRGAGGSVAVDELTTIPARPINVLYVSATRGADQSGRGTSFATPLASIGSALQAASLDGMDTLIYVDHGTYSVQAGSWTATDRVIMIGVNFAQQFSGSLCSGTCAQGRVNVSITGRVAHSTLGSGGYGLAIHGPMHIVGFNFTHAATPLLFTGASEGGAVLEDSVVRNSNRGPLVAVIDGAVELRRVRIRANNEIGVLAGNRGRVTLAASVIDARNSWEPAISVDGSRTGQVMASANVHRSVVMGGSPALEGRSGRVFLTSSILANPDGPAIQIDGNGVEDVEIIGNSFFNASEAVISSATRLVLANNDMRGMEVYVTKEAWDNLANDPTLSNVINNALYLEGKGKKSKPAWSVTTSDGNYEGPTSLAVVPLMQGSASGTSFNFNTLVSDPLFVAGVPRSNNTTPDVRLANNTGAPVDPLRWVSTVSNWRQDILGNVRSDTRASIGAFASPAGTGTRHAYTPTPTAQFGSNWESQSLLAHAPRMSVSLESGVWGPTNIPMYGPADVQEFRLPSFVGSSSVLHFDLWISWGGQTPGPALLTVTGDTTVLARDTVLTTPASTPPESHWTLPLWPNHTNAVNQAVSANIGFSPTFAGSGPTSAPSGTSTIISGSQLSTLMLVPNRALAFERVRIPIGNLSGDRLIRVNVAGPIAGWGITNVRVHNASGMNGETEWAQRARFDEVGRFTGVSQVQRGTGGAASAIAVADVNGDGVLDVVQAGAIDNTTDRVVMNLGSPKLFDGPQNVTFDRVVTASETGPYLLPLGVQPTGRSGLWSARNDGRVAGIMDVMSSASPSFSLLATNTVANVTGAVVTDWNRDGLPDIVALGTTQNTLLFGQANTASTNGLELTGFARGSGFFPSSTNDLGTSTAVIAGDFDNDRFPEVLTDLRGGRMYTSRTPASGFVDRAVRAQPSVSGDRAVIAAADFNNDGWLDVLTSRVPTGNLSGMQLWTNPANANGNFTNTSATRGLGAPQLGGLFAAAWGDYDNDGDLDLVAFHGPTRANATLTVFANSGAPGFTFSPIDTGAETVMNAGNIVLADMNNDGWLDIVTSSGGGSQASRLFLNRMGDNPAWSQRGSLFVRMQGRGVEGLNPLGYQTTIELWDREGKLRLGRRDVAVNPGEPPLVHFGGLDMGATYLIRAYAFDARLGREYVLENEVVPSNASLAFDANTLRRHAIIEERDVRPILRVEGWKPTTADGAAFELNKRRNIITGVDLIRERDK